VPKRVTEPVTEQPLGRHILASAGWIEGELTTVTEGEFQVDDRAVASLDVVNFFVTGGDLLETTQYLWSEFECVRLERRSALGRGALDLHAELLDRSAGEHVLLGYLTNAEQFVWAPINCRVERLLEVFVRADVPLVS
jgi:hypothetical protein